MPYFLLPLPNLLEVGGIDRTACIEMLGDLVDVPANGGKLLGECLDIRGVQVNNVAVNRHFPEVGADPVGGQLRHLLLNQFTLLRRDRAAKYNGTLSVCYDGFLRFDTRVWDVPKMFCCFRERDPKVGKIASVATLAVLAIYFVPLYSSYYHTTIKEVSFGHFLWVRKKEKRHEPSVHSVPYTVFNYLPYHLLVYRAVPALLP